MKPKSIGRIASDLNIHHEDLIPFGYKPCQGSHYRAIERSDRPEGQLILVSAITPTPAGEGKTTISIGLAQGLARNREKCLCCTKRTVDGSSLWSEKAEQPVVAILNFFQWKILTSCLTETFLQFRLRHNLLAAALDNAIYQRQLPDLDPRRITYPRVIDMNDRALRKSYG